jgi:hypothetical protein
VHAAAELLLREQREPPLDEVQPGRPGRDEMQTDAHALREPADLESVASYYNANRTHVALDKDSPATRPVLPPGRGRVLALPRVSGFHHRYDRRAA